MALTVNDYILLLPNVPLETIQAIYDLAIIRYIDERARHAYIMINGIRWLLMLPNWSTLEYSESYNNLKDLLKFWEDELEEILYSHTHGALID